MKIRWLSILQAWAILWVVIGHSRLFGADDVEMVSLGVGGGNPLWASQLGGFPYAFHMALFIFVSGYLFFKTRFSSEKRQWKYVDVMKEKFQRLGIPFLVFTIFAILMKSLFSADMNRPAEISLEYFVYSLIYPYKGAMAEMWFVATILWCFALLPVWKWSFNKKYRTYLLLIILLLLNFWNPELYLLSIGRVCRFALYFYLGMLSCKFLVCEKLIENHKLIAIIIGVILLILGEYMKSGSYIIPLAALFSSLGGIIASVGIAFLLDKTIPIIFASFRDYTYQIFLMGIFFQIAVKMIYKRIDCPYVIGFLACILIGIYGPVLVSILCQKLNWSPLLWCVGLKKRV